MTLSVSNTGIDIIEIAITGIFSTLIEYTSTNFDSGALVMYVIRYVAIQNPMNNEPASPTKSFFTL